MRPTIGIVLWPLLALAAPSTWSGAPLLSPAAAGAPAPIEWVEIPGGTFQMGCTTGDGDCGIAESPNRRITLKQFAMMATEVTSAQYDDCVRSKTCAAVTNDGGPDDPVLNVTWHDAAAFCAWAGGRLPSESEWEYAARSGRSDWRYPWGNVITHDHANYGAERCCAGLAEGEDRWQGASPVGSFPPNRYGLFDVAGNASEWVQDVYGNLDTTPQDGSPRTSRNPEIYTLRGASFMAPPAALRVSYRPSLRGTERDARNGIRCARPSSPRASAPGPVELLGPPAIPVADFMSVNRRKQSEIIAEVATLYVASLSLGMHPDGRLRTDAERRRSTAYASLVRALFTPDPSAERPLPEPIGFSELRVRVPAAGDKGTLGAVLSEYLVGKARAYKLDALFDAASDAQLARLRNLVDLEVIDAEMAIVDARLAAATRRSAEASRAAEEAKRLTLPEVQGRIAREQIAIWSDLGPLVATLIAQAPSHFKSLRGTSVRTTDTIREFRSRLLAPATQAAGQPLAAWLLEAVPGQGIPPGAIHVLRVSLGGLQDPAPPLRFAFTKQVLNSSIPISYARTGLDADQHPVRWTAPCGATGEGRVTVSLDYESSDLQGLVPVAQGPVLEVTVTAMGCVR